MNCDHDLALSDDQV